MQLHEILTNYEDFELAFLKEFKFQTYLSGTKKAIDDEIKKRNLTERDMESLKLEKRKEKFNDNKLRCPRCKSLKIEQEDVEFWNTYGRAGYADNIAVMDGYRGKATYKKKLTCIICDYVILDPNKGGLIKIPNFIRQFVSGIFGYK